MADQSAADQARIAAEAHLGKVTEDYSQYVAVVPIDIDGSRAFNPGHPVPASHVKSKVVALSQVAKVNTKAAENAALVPAVLPAEKG